ncbi:MAG TPA: hypothetical protein VLZ83_09890 [Edaphocola sp.]|nr:hypothetical protein [Edaphocola sp.]
MIYNYDDFGQFFIIIDKNINKEVFLANVKAEPGTFAEDMFVRIYDSIFSELINLEEEFEKYYSVEYKSIQHFLFQKFCFPSDVIEDFFSLKSQRESYCIFYKHEKDSYGDYSITRYAFSEEMYDKVTSILLLKDYEN